MDAGTGGAQGHFPPPHVSKSRGKCPFSYNVNALLEKVEDAKIRRKIHDSGDFRRSKFQNLKGEHAPGRPSRFTTRDCRNIDPFLKYKMFCRSIECLTPQKKCSMSLPEN